jgi:hypothetical protein
MARALGTDDSITNCDCCGKSGLKFTVIMELDDGEIAHYGQVCAGRNTGKTRPQITREIKAHAEAQKAAARAEFFAHPAYAAERAQFAARPASGTQYSATSTIAIDQYRWHDAGAAYEPGTLHAWLDGIEVADIAVGASETPTVRFALANTSGPSFLVPVVYLWAGYHPEFMPELSRNPWQLFRHRLYKFVSLGSGGAYTLTADAGTYSVSAADAGMRAARRLSANAGSYAYSGAAAGLYVGRRLTADAAAYSVTGNDAVLSYSGGVTHYTMTADAGSFAVTGSAASLLAGRKLVAAAGSYSVGGQTAAFARAYRLTADATSYSVSLNAATLTYSGAGSLLWTPQTPGAASWVAQSAGPATWTPQ